MTLRTDALAQYEKLTQAVNMSAEETLATSDRIQKRVKVHPELTALCEFSGTMQMRRLLTIPHRVWKVMELRWAEQMLAKLTKLKKDSSAGATLALACLGYARHDLAQVLAKLDADPEPEPVKKPTAKKAPAKAKKNEAAAIPVPPLEEHPEDALDEELDPETQAMLADLRKQAEQAQAGT